MNISFNAQNPYSNTNQRAYGTPFSEKQVFSQQNAARNKTAGNRALCNQTNGYNNANDTGTRTRSWEMRSLIRNLTQTQTQNQNPYAVNPQDKVNGFLDLLGAPKDEEEEKLQETPTYNYKEVASKIQRAKTSASAGQAVLSAKRKVLEIKRQIASGKGDAEDLQLALTHAKRMEMVARKKKHHLELEEMVNTTRKRDEKLDQMEEAASEMKNAMVDMEQEKVTEAEDAIFEKRHDMLDELMEGMEESGADISQDMLAEMNAMIAEFGEEELKELEEAMEQLENLEVLDPHMSKEDLEELKRKHRSSENKAIMKADMDYLKGMIRHAQEKGGSIPGMGNGLGNAVSTQAMSVAAVSTGIAVSAPGVDVSAPSIDIQV